MDLTTLLAGAFLLVAAFGFDAVWHPRDIVLQVTRSDSLGQVHVSEKMVSDILQSEVDNIFVTPSVAAKHDVRLRGELGLGLSLIEAIGLSRVTDALQRQIGNYPDEIILHVYSENGVTKVLVTGYDATRGTDFDQEVAQVKDEAIVSLTQRAAITGVAHIAPYMTALSLMRRHIQDKDFHRSQEVIRYAKSQLPRSRPDPQRSLLENLEGMIALFNDDAGQARERFQKAVDSDPGNRVAMLNLALMDAAAKNGTHAISLVQNMMAKYPTDDPLVLSTCYLTLAVAHLELHQAAAADAAMEKAAAFHPDNPGIPSVWAEVKHALGDERGAKDWQEKASAVERGDGGYAEVAALYLAVGWKDGAPVLLDAFDTVAAAPDIAGLTAPTAPEAAVTK